MNLQPVVQTKSSANGFPHRSVERDGGTRSENKVQSAKSNSGRISKAEVGSKAANLESPSRDRLVYLTTCLIGHPVEAQLKNGSVYTGIFHATDVEKGFGIILKMARMSKDGPSRGQKLRSEFVSKAHSKMLIIPANELVQVIAEDVAVTRDGFSNDLRSDKQLELLTDSYISRSVHVEMERELKPWIPDEDVPQCLELENIFDGPWHRGWDQFEANEMLFGVKSTFNEELYTTKLERGPQMRNLEHEATRIAREIEDESTQDLHIAEERGYQLDEKFDIDEETRYSSVHRGGGFDDSGHEDKEGILLDSHNGLTFGGPSASDRKKTASTGSKISDEAWDDRPSSQSNINVDLNCSVSDEHALKQASERSSKDFPALDSESRMENQFGKGENSSDLKFVDKQIPAEDFSLPNPGDSLSSLSGKGNGDKGGPSADAIIFDSSCVPSKTDEKQSSAGRSRNQVSGKAIGSTKSDSSDNAAAASAFSGPGLSPSSSVGSLSSEKSTLNPNAKEFKLNPNAKSFKPSHSSPRPPSPMSDGSFYHPAGMSAVPQMPGMPVAFGMSGPSYAGHQPVIYTPQLAPVQSPQAYFPPNGPQYGQQMLVGQPRPVVYMATYQPEMPYKGRDY